MGLPQPSQWPCRPGVTGEQPPACLLRLAGVGHRLGSGDPPGEGLSGRATTRNLPCSTKTLSPPLTLTSFHAHPGPSTMPSASSCTPGELASQLQSAGMLIAMCTTTTRRLGWGQ
jgi:hypothetical protein